MASYLRPRRGKKATAIAQLTASAPLKRGEVFFEVPDGGTGTGAGRIKMGDGSTAYESLPYFLEPFDPNSATIGFTDASAADSDPYANNGTYAGNIVPSASLKTIFTNLKKLLLNYNSQLTKLNNDLDNTNSSLSNYLPLTGGNISGGLNVGGNVNFWTDGEGGNIEIKSNAGNTWQFDAINGDLRFYTSNSSGGLVFAPFSRETGNFLGTAANADTVDGKHFHWSGQAGQPEWLWGGNNADQNNMYVWNPSNFNVNYANSAGSAGSASYAESSHCLRTFSAGGGSHGTAWWLKCRHNVHSDGRFKIYCENTDGSKIETRVDYATACDTASWANNVLGSVNVVDGSAIQVQIAASSSHTFTFTSPNSNAAFTSILMNVKVTGTDGNVSLCSIGARNYTCRIYNASGGARTMTATPVWLLVRTS